ncbi:MAG TPA: IPT/TIG domain-containing protein, partial [Thermoanaerobaculia bacterium]
MRSLAIIVSLVALPLSAANLWFDPPNPTSRTPVVAHVRASVSCLPNGTSVSIGGHNISITLKQIQPCTVPSPADGFLWTADLGVLPAGAYDVAAGPEMLLIALAEAKLSVADANAPFTVSPNVAWTTGGDVTITGLTLPACSVGTCAAPLVTFGGSEAQIEEFGPPDKLVVYAPAHDAGTVDVIVRYGGQTYTATAAFNYFVPTGVTDPAFFEPVLFPVMITGPGAFGSNWTTEVTMRNENDYPLPVTSVFDQTCFPVCDARPAAHSTAIVLGASAPNGLLLNIPRQSSPKLFFGTLIRDLSRQSEALGTEI